jgi:hypothetical protein
MSFSEGCAVVLASVFVICLALFLAPALELWLWGLVMVPVFGAPVLTYWQMFALNWLCGLLFRSRVTVNNKK